MCIFTDNICKCGRLSLYLNPLNSKPSLEMAAVDPSRVKRGIILSVKPVNDGRYEVIIQENIPFKTNFWKLYAPDKSFLGIFSCQAYFHTGDEVVFVSGGQDVTPVSGEEDVTPTSGEQDGLLENI